MSFTFTYSGDPSDSALDGVRFEVADTDQNAPLLYDAEVNWAIAQESSGEFPMTAPDLFSAAARCCEVLARRFAAQADSQVGSLRLIYSKQSVTYAQRACELRTKAMGLRGFYVGGTSISEKAARAQDSDYVRPAFRRREFDSPYTGPPGGGGPTDIRDG